ncbi:uncharacterized protein N7459_004725 [Penicillium hispanicum]|uniref:uncharacterized protein n=1 Tax=Penicillium hispanicum TaxID=1080232 RepID=UPI00253F6BD7|nr:uncharacterized protein N7459_004725 [Penicillium hispanicum]KAJ5584925.1 hypothetical protein N7459_004725 [Penicillium hispanicum]
MTSPTASSTRQGRVLLDPWPLDGVHYAYIDVEQFFRKLSSIATTFEDESRANGPWILFTDVDEQAFDAIQNSDSELSHSCAKIYDPNNCILWVKMESVFHGTAAMGITRWMENKITEMQLNSEVLFTGATNYEIEILDEAGNQCVDDNGSVMVRRKRADQTVHPFSVPPPRTMQWPSLILETSYTEPRRHIMEELRLWLLASNNEVKFAMAAFVNQRRQNISIEQWELIDRPTETVQHRYTLNKVQGISVEKPKDGQTPIVRGRFEIPFSSIFLRDPQNNETNLVMTKEDIIQIARQVWAVNSIMIARGH